MSALALPDSWDRAAGGAVILTTGTVCGAGLPSDGF